LYTDESTGGPIWVRQGWSMVTEDGGREGGRREAAPEQWSQQRREMEAVTLTLTRARAFIGGTAPSPTKRPRVPAKEDSIPASERRSREEDGVSRDGGGEGNEWRQANHAGGDQTRPRCTNSCRMGLMTTPSGQPITPYRGMRGCPQQ
jgi:hypothetical protein